MKCKRCGKPMREEKRSFHKQRKWVCPRCGRARMQRVGGRTPRRRRDVSHDGD